MPKGASSKAESTPSSVVVLLSGGLDSAVNLFCAHQHSKVLLALTFNYGQRASEKEVSASRKLCQFLGVSHQVVTLPFFTEFSNSALTNAQAKIPMGAEVDVDSLRVSQKTASAVWVPNRNGIFLNIAAGFAEGLGASHVVPGFNIEEAQTFPDNSEAFLQTLNDSFSFSTSSKVKTHCWTTNLNKSQIVALGKTLATPFADIWPCYESMEKWCGRCESCLRSLRALRSNQINCDDWI